jgi:hypothetical protein
MQAIRAGIVDVIAIGPPQDLMLKREGYAILAGPQDVGIALPTPGLAATSRMTARKPTAGQKNTTSNAQGAQIRL